MQTIKIILKLTGGTAAVVDEYGKGLAAPEIKVGIAAALELDLRSNQIDDETGILKPYPFEELSGADGFYLAMDSDYDQETDPKMLRFDGITLTQSEDGRTVFYAPIPNTATPGIMEAVGKGVTVTLNTEFAGYDGDSPAQAVFAWAFSMVVRNRVYLGDKVPDEVMEDPEYLTAAQIRALIAEATRPEQGKPGTGIANITKTGTDGLVDTYTITLTDGNTATFTVKNGAGISNIEKTDSSGLVDTYAITLTDGTSGGTFQVRNGRGIERISLTKTEGNIDTHTIYYTDETTTEFHVIHGKDGPAGKDLKIDATGLLSERDAYAMKEAGFTFAGTETSKEEKVTRLYLYVKKSAEYNDWCNPAVITYYSQNGKDGENVKLIPPIEFKAAEKEADYLYFSRDQYPAATIAWVVIDTDDGELTLPYGSALGITKILRKEKTFYVYFGNLVPEYETGRIYFAQGVAEKTLWMLYQEQGGKYSYNDFCSKIFELIGEGKTLTGTTVYVISGKQGEALTQALDVAAADGSDVSYAVTEGTLPAGLTLSGSTISGTPEENGTSAVTITASAGGANLEISVTFMIDQALKMYYGYVNDGATYKVSQITGDMLTLQTVTEADAGAMQINVTAPAGAVLFVLVPADSGLTVTQDDGVGGKVPFNEDNGATGTGANGIDLTLNGITYKAYGEFSLVDAETIIYIGE